jgi:membrane-associated phospholipid phosphatase
LLILLSFGNNAIDGNNPYAVSTTQQGFNTFGGPHILNLISKAADLALKAAWYQKWQVHRRLRPEVFSGRVHNQKLGLANYGIDSKLINDSDVLPLIFDHNRNQNINRFSRNVGTYLQPQAFPEGSPTHPAYPAGHATFIAAGVTMLKAFFREDYLVPDPVKPSADGKELLPYQAGVDGPALTVGGELNKLAANIAIGRNIAGVHWRSDGLEGNNLGEAVAISILRDLRKIYNEDFTGFSITKFDGNMITI